MNRVLTFAVVEMSAVIMKSGLVDVTAVNLIQGSTSDCMMMDDTICIAQGLFSF